LVGGSVPLRGLSSSSVLGLWSLWRQIPRCPMM
jgi:hypothetical protein